jgi:hypothetical protein
MTESGTGLTWLFSAFRAGFTSETEDVECPKKGTSSGRVGLLSLGVRWFEDKFCKAERAGEQLDGDGVEFCLAVLNAWVKSLAIGSFSLLLGSG